VIHVGVLGYGYWGPNLARILGDTGDVALDVICDPSSERLESAGRAHPQVRLTNDWQAVVADPAIDAVAITTPAGTHFELGLAALRAGKHVLVEKPLACRAAEAEILVEESRRRRLVLMVDHTFVYSAPVRAIKRLLDSGQLGAPWYYDSVRANLGIVRSDVNVLWDLATHDLAVLDHLHPTQPVAIHATGVTPGFGGGVPDERQQIAYLTLHYPGGFIAHVHVNWLAPLKIRRVLLGGSRRMVVWDDLEPLEKVKLYDSGIEPGPTPGELHYRSGSVTPADLDGVEPLRALVHHFTECIETGRTPITDGAAGLRVVRLLEAADRSLAQGGRALTLDTEVVRT
jgi:predicted dehydrogenase